MIRITSYEEGLDLFKALSSQVRLNIVKLLAENGPMAPAELAQSLGLTPSALTSHTQKLEEAKIIGSENRMDSGYRKVFTLLIPEILLDVATAEKEPTIGLYETSVPIGNGLVSGPTAPCGVALEDGTILANDPCVFAENTPSPLVPLLFMTEGRILYHIPNQIPEDCHLVQLTLSLEISSCRFGDSEKDKGEIAFSLNGRPMGTWITFPDSGYSRGLYTPSWWLTREMQHGFLKMIVVNNNGVYLDGKKISDFHLDSLDIRHGSEINFELSCQSSLLYQGGMALYGKGFGNYQQDLQARIHYMPDQDV